MSQRALRVDEKRVLALLGLPTAALALAITVVTTYLPVVAQTYLESSAAIGALIAIEGVMALWVPLVVGAWSDSVSTPIGRRLPFLVVATPALIVTLPIIGFAQSTAVAGLAAALFFLAYFVAYEPYRALYPDLVDVEVAGRAQGTQALWRGAGTGVALVGGGLLVAVWSPLPFLAAAAVTAAAMGGFLHLARRRRDPRAAEPPAERLRVRQLRRLLEDHPGLRAYLLANALWEASLSALKTFVFLFIVVGLGKSEAATAAIVGGVALVALVGAPISGVLGDRIGRVRLMRRVLPFYGLGLIVPAFTHAPPLIVPTMVLVGFAGGLVMTLPFAILHPLMPVGRHGALTGFYSVSRGLGAALGPLLAGVAIQLLADAGGPFSATDGYAAMWLVCGATVLLSLWPTAALARVVGER